MKYFTIGKQNFIGVKYYLCSKQLKSLQNLFVAQPKNALYISGLHYLEINLSTRKSHGVAKEQTWNYLEGNLSIQTFETSLKFSEKYIALQITVLELQSHNFSTLLSLLCLSIRNIGSIRVVQKIEKEIFSKNHSFYDKIIFFFFFYVDSYFAIFFDGMMKSLKSSKYSNSSQKEIRIILASTFKVHIF